MTKYDYGRTCRCGLYEQCIPPCSYYEMELNREHFDIDYWKYLFLKEIKKMNDKDLGDFGFTLVDNEEVVQTDTRAETLRDMIMPFLRNLQKNPEKDYIAWPGKDRVKKIEEFIQKIESVVNKNI